MPFFVHSTGQIHRPADAKGCIADWARDTSGNVAMAFGLLIFVLLMLVGGAVDVARWLNARGQTRSAVDAAVLAGGRALQTNGGNAADAIAMAKRYYDQAVSGRISVANDTVTFVVADNGASIVASGNAQITTPFMQFAGIPVLPLLKMSGAESAKANLAIGSNAEVNLEVALMLDTSGSMADATSTGNSKIDDLKLAASDLVNIIVWDNQTTYRSRVALVPFSGDVRIPGGWLSQVEDPSWPSSQTLGGNNGNGRGNGGGFGMTFQKTACVAERAGGNPHTDATPGPNAYIMNAYTPDGQCSQRASADEVVAMTSDKNKLLSSISNLELGGGTAGHIGTAWAYYMLSPNWTSIVPQESAASAYGAPKTQKIAVLMTDGEYNFTYDNNGIPSAFSGGNGNGNGNSSASQAKVICNQMKQDGIKVFTIGFALGGNATAIDTLSQCASDPGKFYNAEDGTQLKAAFRDIALKVSGLYLTQ